MPPPTAALGALLGHITGGHIEAHRRGPTSFQPMNINFGLFPRSPRHRPTVQTAAAARPRKGGRAQARAVRSAPSPILETWIASDIAASG